MTKSIEHQFVDWESHVFGYGYGTGEAHVLPALRKFLAAVPTEGSYSHEELENEVTPAVAWLLINALAHADIIEYGSSPRFGWLTPEGKKLREFVVSRTDDDLYELVAGRDEIYVCCYPDACNCGPGGYQEGVRCENAFWRSTLPNASNSDNSAKAQTKE